MANLRHPNCVMFIGCVAEPPMIVLELMPLGTVFGILHVRKVDVDWSAVEDNVSVGIDVRGSGTVTVTNSDLTSNGSDAVVVVGGQGEPDVSVTSCNLDGNGLTANGTWVPLWWSVARGTHQELVETQNYVAPGGVPVEAVSWAMSQSQSSEGYCGLSAYRLVDATWGVGASRLSAVSHTSVRGVCFSAFYQPSSTAQITLNGVFHQGPAAGKAMSAILQTGTVDATSN